MLSEQAKKNKVAYNMRRNKELYKKFAADLPKEEYFHICEFLKDIQMNKTEFIRWAFDKLMEEYQ